MRINYENKFFIDSSNKYAILTPQRESGWVMEYNFEDESRPYSSDDAYEDLEKVKKMLQEAQRKINKDKLKKTEIDISIQIDVENP